MSTGKPKRITLNIYLLKEASNSASEWTDKDFIASPVGSNGKPKKISTEQYPLGPEGEYGTLFIRKPLIEAAPEWLNFIQKGLDKGVKTSKWTNRSISAILIVKNGARQFAISFGYGRYLIEPRLIEDRFGIKVVLNSVSPDKIASIDRQTFDASPRLSRTQTIKAASVSDYIINAEQDLLRGLVGHTKGAYSNIFGKIIAGIDSFKASVAIELSDLGDLLQLAFERSTSKDYLAKDADGQASEFSWVENLVPVKDKDISEILDTKLWQSLASSQTGNMWLSIPDIIDWTSVTGFSYKRRPGSDDIDPVLDLERFLSTFRQGANLDTLKRREIFLILSDGTPPRPFPAFKCLYAEVKHDANLYILNTGNWFKVEASFQTAVEKYFLELPRKPFAPPFAEYSHAGEGPYNEYVCAQAPSSHAMLDRQMIKFGGSYDKVEVCDIYRVKTQTERGEFIHVKRGRGSSTLSHLFAQGFVASTLMVRESGFVKDVNLQLEKNKFEAIPINFEARDNDVIYAIIDGPASKALDIPFFSKVTLQNYGKTISSYGYGVKLMHIPESAAYLASIAQKKQLKPPKRKQPIQRKKTVRKTPPQPKSGP